MKIILSLLILIFISCNKQQGNSVSTDDLLPISQIFNAYRSDSLIIAIHDDLSVYQDNPTIGLDYAKYFELVKSFDWIDKTSLIPQGMMELTNANYLLVVSELDDYGVITYGLLYSSALDKIVSKEVLAQAYSDAGTTQTVESVVKGKPTPTLTRLTSVCEYEINFDVDPPEVSEPECQEYLESFLITDSLLFKKN